jgi:hypothetical protein
MKRHEVCSLNEFIDKGIPINRWENWTTIRIHSQELFSHWGLIIHTEKVTIRHLVPHTCNPRIENQTKKMLCQKNKTNAGCLFNSILVY